MNWKTTLILLTVAVVMLLVFNFYENKQPGTRELTQDATRVLILNRDEVTGLVVTNHDLKVDLRRNAQQQWTMKSPYADRADQTLINELFTDMESARREDVFTVKADDKNKLQEYGLQNPRVRLQVVAKGSKTPTEVLFGNDTPVEGRTYMEVAGQDKVYVIPDELKKLLEKDVNSWRDHRLTDLVPTRVTKAIVKNPAGEIELQREGDHWRLTKPLSARANDTKVNDLVSQVANLNVQSFVGDDKADTAAYGLTEPRGTVTLFTAADPKGQEVLIGTAPGAPKPAAPGEAAVNAAVGATPAPTPDPKLADTVYIRFPERKSIYAVPKSIESFLTLKPADLRDRQLARVNADMVDRIRITPEDGKSFTLVHDKDKKWNFAGAPAGTPPANSAEADRLFNAINNAQVTSFVADSASDLAKYGLDKPVLQVSFLSVASENTAESNAGEKPAATVDFGRTEGVNIYARVAEEPFVVSVPATILGSIAADPLQWQDVNIFQADPEKISSVNIAVPDRPELALTRAEKGGWTISKGTGPLDTGKAQSIVNTLAHLHAVRWVGAARPPYGLDNPVETITFATNADAKGGGKLMLGGISPEQMGYAKVAGREGVFLVSRPDYETLTASPVPVPTSTPAPAAGTPPPAPTPGLATPTGPTPTPATPASTPLPAVPATPTPTPATPTPTPATPTPMPATPTPTPMPAAPTPTPATPTPMPAAPTPTPATPTPMPETPTPMPATPAPTSVETTPAPAPSTPIPIPPIPVSGAAPVPPAPSPTPAASENPATPDVHGSPVPPVTPVPTPADVPAP